MRGLTMFDGAAGIPVFAYDRQGDDHDAAEEPVSVFDSAGASACTDASLRRRLRLQQYRQIVNEPSS